MYNIFTYANYLIAGYGISTIAFLAATAFVKRFRLIKNNYLMVANLFAVILGLTVAAITVINYYQNYANAVENDFAFPGYKTQFIIAIFFTGLIPLLFLVKKFRKNIFITFIVIVSLNWFVFYEQVYIWITHFYRDYMPSSWSAEYSQSPIAYIAVATIIYFGLAFTITSIRKSERLAERL
jgi:hypothetical protein